MRSLAASLRATSNTVGGIDAAVWQKVSGLTFTGPAADRLVSTIGGWHSGVSNAAASLASTAAMLERVATEVEEAQVAERARLLEQHHADR